ncbi:hypothetical protein PLICRDRAFT_33591 [Plicaturopsis crispa FD-325 SS-3]|nr:hypothetical protein PLICRDRAFT_33591 [Plicaturopsis crispa FD-325 SS-3]
MSSDENDLLSILEAHGQQFLSAFSIPESTGKKRRRKLSDQDDSRQSKAPRKSEDSASDIEHEEWTGFGASGSDDEDESQRADDENGAEDFEQEDDGFVADTSSRKADVVVFSDPRSHASTSNLSSKAQMKAFMSSKVSKLRDEVLPDAKANEPDDADVEDERNNAQDDALLHRLVHTKLLSGSLNPELNLTSAQRKKALAGRVLEVSGKVKLGKGERAVREKERNRAAKHVRDGMVDKQKERQEKELEEAKHLGNYHPALKKLFDPSSTSTSAPVPRKRDRGLKLGVGKFSGGMLRLSKDEIANVNNGGVGRGGSRGGSRGRGGRGRGRGGGRGRG